MRCGVCGCDRLSPQAEVFNRAVAAATRLVFGRPAGQRSRPAFSPSYARVCLGCGAVLQFVSRADLAEIGEITEDQGVHETSPRFTGGGDGE